MRGLRSISTLVQLRYEEMSKNFAQVADLTANDEMWSYVIMEWIKCQCKDLMTTKSSSGSDSISQHTTHVSNDYVDISKSASGNVFGSKLIRRKGTPKKLWRKSLLEMASKKAKLCLNICFKFIIVLN